MQVLEEGFLTLENAKGALGSIWSTERSALVADVLRDSGHLRLRVYGESMLPTLWPGDVVEIEGCAPEDVRSGEIVLAQRDGRLFLHRLVAPCAPNGFLLRGDSLPSPDPVFPPEALLGRFVRRVHWPAPGAASDFEEVTVSLQRYPATNRSFSATCATAPHRGISAKWPGAKWSRAVGMLLCYCGLARRLALRLHSRGNSSARAFRNPEHGPDVSPAELTQ